MSIYIYNENVLLDRESNLGNSNSSQEPYNCPTQAEIIGPYSLNYSNNTAQVMFLFTF